MKNQIKHNKIIHNDNLVILKQIPDKVIDLIYIDPPFNSNKIQLRKNIKTTKINTGDNNKNNILRKGFADKNYTTEILSETSYNDKFNSSEEYLDFIKLRLIEAKRILKDNGSLFFHIDYREVHYCKVLLDEIFGRSSFINEIIWAYDYGARNKNKWSAKHDNILFYAKDPKNYTYNYDKIDRIPYMAPGLVGKVKADKGKTPTDVWWNTIVSPNNSSREKTGYATQKPLKIIERIVKVHSNKNDLLLDFFAGSGTLGQAAINNNRRFILVDNNIQAINIMQKRLGVGVVRNYEE